MDPNLFHVDWEQLFEILAAVVVLSFVVERGLALLFEHRFFVSSFAERGFKEPIALGLSVAVCWYWDFDFISVLMTSDGTSVFGKVLTAALIAGGSKASIKLFKDLMGVQSDAAKAASAAKTAASTRGARQ